MLNAQMTQDLGNKPTNEFAVCLAEGDRQAKELYVLAAEQVAAKPAAVAALKEHLIRVLAQLRGLKANTNEPKVNYNARQASLKAAVQEAWNRFEVEAL